MRKARRGDRRSRRPVVADAEPSARRLRYFRIVAAAVAIAAVAVGCGGGDEASDVLVVGVRTDPPTLDPHVHGDRMAYQIDRHIFDTLVVRDDESQEFRPSLATEWENSPDGKTYTFTLRDDVTFHDGTQFNAEAVVFNLNRVVDPATKSQTAKDILGPYKSSRALGPYEVQVEFETTTSPTAVLDALSQAYLGMVSPAAVREHGAAFGRNPVGTGPFVFERWVANDRLEMVRNEDYNWAPDTFENDGPPQLAGVTVRIMPDGATRVAALESGEIHVDYQAEVTAVERLRGNEDIEVYRGVAPGFPVVIWMNVEAEPFTDLRVRQAVLHAFDRETMMESVYRGEYPPAYGPLSDATWSYDESVEDMYPYDPERAAELLEQAGWRLGPDGIRVKNGRKLQARFFDGEDPRRGEYLQENLRKIGFDLIVRIVSFPDLYAVTRKANTYDMASTWFASSDPSILNVVFLSQNIGTGFAISRWRDERLDAMLEEGVQIVDDGEREQHYKEIQRYIMENAVMVPMYAETELDGVRKEYTGYALERGQYFLLYDVGPV
jgi:peptide/nickel transport system substrate-binding protein